MRDTRLSRQKKGTGTADPLPSYAVFDLEVETELQTDRPWRLIQRWIPIIPARIAAGLRAQLLEVDLRLFSKEVEDVDAERTREELGRQLKGKAQVGVGLPVGLEGRSAPHLLQVRLGYRGCRVAGLPGYRFPRSPVRFSGSPICR